LICTHADIHNYLQCLCTGVQTRQVARTRGAGGGVGDAPLPCLNMHHSMTFEMHFVCFILAVSFSRIRDAPFRVFHYHLSHRIYSALIIGGATLRGAAGQTVELPLHSSRAAAATTLIIHHACCVWFMNTIRDHATRHAQWIRQKTSPLGAYYQFAPRASHRRGLLLRTSDIAWSARLSVRVLDRTHR